MKLNKLCLLVFLILFSSSVKADCTTEEINTLKKDADKIKVTYELLETNTDEYKLEIDSISNKFYITLDDIDNKYYVEDNKNAIIINNSSSGKHTIKIYSSKCNKQIDTISFRLPKLNSYYYDPLCIGIDEEEFELCGKYYNYDVSYEDFKQRVERYRYINNIGYNQDEEDDVDKGTTFDKIYNFINIYKKYILLGTSILLIIILLIVLIKHKKKRGVLK